MGFKLKICSPEGVVLERDVELLSVKSTSGWLGILPNHRSLVTTLLPAKISFQTKHHIYYAAISGGVLKVSDNNALILADGILFKDQVDVERAKAALKNALERLEARDSDLDKERAERKVARNQARIDLAEGEGRKRIN